MNATEGLGAQLNVTTGGGVHPGHDRLPIVVFCHLRWNFVFQRPQHLITRLAKEREVIFIEEPVRDLKHAPHIDCRLVAPNLLVCQPHTHVEKVGFCEEQAEFIRPQISQLLHKHGISEYVLWFYSPMALPMAADLAPKAVIYDCMDELSAFANAPIELLDREQQLLELSDAVFTGGPSLYEAKKDRHPHVYCFPSSVDAQHFGTARVRGEESSRQAALPHPRLGFFGVIDERFDVEILDFAARNRPNWQFVLVGPVVKIDPAILPVRPNIHYMGQHTYEELPRFLAGWDVCLLPFARNEATRFISPTKTLEYMAAERMIVSTPIADVAEPYGDIVFLGDSPSTFLEACQQALDVSSADRKARIEQMRKVLSATSWEATAAAMSKVAYDVAALKHAGTNNPDGADGATAIAASAASNGHARSATASPRSIRTEPRHFTQSAAPVVVIGAGPTGLSAAYHLEDDVLLLEANQTVGGWCRSVELNGFTFDYAGHIMFSNDAYVHEMYKTLLGDNVHWQDREAWIYSKGVYTRYPFQGGLHGLPPEVITECIMGAIEARFGSLGKPGQNGSATNGNHNGNGHANGHKCAAKSVDDCCGDGVLESTAPLGVKNGHPGDAPANFEDFIYNVWGSGIAKHFAIPYNKKLWAVPLSEMETSWLGGRVPMPDLAEIIEGALKPVPKPMGPNARFGYPLHGGFQSLMNGFLPFIQDSLQLGARVVAISPQRRIVTLAEGTEIGFDALISTMPLPALVRAMGDEVPPDVRAAATALRNVSVRCVHIGVGREHLTEKHWIYYPENTVFHRVFVQGNASPHCNPPGGFGLTCEITYSPHKPLPCDGDALVQRCIDDCIEVGIIKSSDPIWASTQCDLPYAYVVYDHARPKNVNIVRQWLDSQRIELAGRYSEWEYYNSDHAFLAGKKAAERVRASGAREKITAELIL